MEFPSEIGCFFPEFVRIQGVHADDPRVGHGALVEPDERRSLYRNYPRRVLRFSRSESLALNVKDHAGFLESNAGDSGHASNIFSTSKAHGEITSAAGIEIETGQLLAGRRLALHEVGRNGSTGFENMSKDTPLDL